MYREMGDDGEVLETEARIAECLMLQGDLARALAACDTALRQARALGGVPPQLPLLHRVRGWCLMRMGRVEEVDGALEESLRAARSRHAEFEIALSLYARAALARVRGGRDEQAEHESRAILDRLGVVRVPGIPTGTVAIFDGPEITSPVAR